MDRLAPTRSATAPAARQRPRSDAENFGGEVSLRTSLLHHSITSSARPSRAGEIGKFGPYGGARGTGSGPRKKPKVPKFVRCWLFAEGAEIGEPSPTPF